MKQTISSLAKFAKEITYKKFIKLSIKKQHELLACLAYESIGKNSLDEFMKQYEKLHEWGELDRFSPAFYLSENEKLKSYFDFHRSFSPVPITTESDKQGDAPLIWEPQFDLTIFMDQIRSPYNIGSILRIADNFGLKEVVHSSPEINFNHPRLKKASRKSHLWIPLRYEKDPVLWLKQSKEKVVGLEKTKESIKITNWKPPKSIILVAGNEENGISHKILSCCDEIVEIPLFGFKKSMNVNNAVSIISNKFVELNI